MVLRTNRAVKFSAVFALGTKNLDFVPNDNRLIRKMKFYETYIYFLMICEIKCWLIKMKK